ncbi:MAG: response regulator transcription factor [Ilumatobacter fluminis]|uniref:response regulator transcription factor n=1 Tax=Ilumatobacter fluminis TaxID=467091 RepID=UPI0032EB102D
MRLLVVDDEVRLAESIARALRAEGFDVDMVHDGNDAIWQAQQVDYAVIILDIMLPGLNGFAVCRDLRAAGNTTPILMLTAKEGEYDEAEALDTGADDYLRKPFSLVVLVARIRALLRRGRAASVDEITVGELHLDRGQVSATWGDTDAVQLTPREFAVIDHLARQAPDVVTKQGLVDAVWGFDFAGDPNIAEVYVGYLRRKLGRDVIRTVRHVGYQITGEPTETDES